MRLFLILISTKHRAFYSLLFSLLQFSRSVVSDSCNPMNRSTPGLPVHHHLPKLTQTHVFESVMPSNHRILCHPLLLPPSIFPSIRVFSNESVFRIRWPKYWSFGFSLSPFNDYSGLIPYDGQVGSPCSPTDSQEFSPTPQFKSISPSALSLLYSPTLTFIHA